MESKKKKAFRRNRKKNVKKKSRPSVERRNTNKQTNKQTNDEGGRGSKKSIDNNHSFTFHDEN